MSDMQNIGVIFTSSPITSKKGTKYYSGKSEGSEEFDLMAFPRISKNGKDYLSIVKVLQEQEEVTSTPSSTADDTVSVDDLPF